MSAQLLYPTSVQALNWVATDESKAAMDHIKKQDFRFGRYLKASMQEETISYVAQLFRENRPVILTRQAQVVVGMNAHGDSGHRRQSVDLVAGERSGRAS